MVTHFFIFSIPKIEGSITYQKYRQKKRVVFFFVITDLFFYLVTGTYIKKKQEKERKRSKLFYPYNLLSKKKASF